jgi:calcineurin-like phosphoesterase family protein
MSRDIWLISDTHFFHKNILTFEDKNGKLFRGDLFKDIDHMNEVMVDNWNRRVKPGDIVYHLGDVMIGPKEDFAKLWARLNGRKRLIVGNHDDIKYLSSGSFFNKVSMWRVFRDHGLVLTHVPMHESSFLGRRNDTDLPVLNVHGHIHQNKSPTDRHINVSVEAINYTPIHIEEVRKLGNG